MITPTMRGALSLRVTTPRTILALLVLLLAAAGWADTIKLKDGRTLNGIIDMAGSDDQRVIIRTTTGILPIPRAKILSIDRQENISFTEASGDLAAADKNLDQALDLYQKALDTDPNNERLKKKAENLKKMIQARERNKYGLAFGQIEQLITDQKFDEAIKQAQDLRNRLREEAGRNQCQMLIAQAWLARGRRNLEYIAYPEAESDFKQAMQNDPENPTPPLELGRLLQNSPDRKEEAIKYFEKGIELTGKHPGTLSDSQLLEPRFQLAQLYMSGKNYRKAAEEFLQVTRADKTSQKPAAVDFAIEAYTKIQDSLTPEDIKSAVANLRAIIELKPHDARPYQLLGMIYYKQNDWANARDMLKVAVKEASPTASALSREEALYHLGISYRKLGQNDAAAEALQTMVDQKTVNYDAICELGEVRVDQKNYDDAMTLFKQAIEQDADKTRAYLGKGRALMGLAVKNKELYKQARENFRKVLERDKENLDTQMAMARSYYEEKEWDNTSNECQKAIDLIAKKLKEEEGDKNRFNQMGAEAWSMMGESNIEGKKPNLARENFEKSLKLIPDYAPALEGIGLTYQTDNQHKEAEKYFQQAVDRDPKNPLYYLRLGICWHKYLKDPEKALTYYMKYLDLGGRDPQVPDWIRECGGTPPKGFDVPKPKTAEGTTTGTATAAVAPSDKPTTATAGIKQ